LVPCEIASEGADLYQFKAEQKVYNIGGVTVGGDVGENPTVMIGSIFHKGDSCILDEGTGEIDRKMAEALIKRVEEQSDRTGLQAMLDIVCSIPGAVRDYLDFCVDATEMPILVDAVSEEAAIKGIEHSEEMGILDRTIFNSLNPHTSKEVLVKIKEAEIRSAIALTYSSEAVASYVERVRLLETLIPRVTEAGVRNILVDTFVMDVPTLGLSCRAIYEVKDRYGYPTGCGAHNAVGSWKSLQREKDQRLKLVCGSVVDSLPIAAGADFVFYGPINGAEYVFTAVGIIDACYGQVQMEWGKRLRPDHPRFKMAGL
jgi:tetrahydromethanopterin S-methyltransferase subunit H